MPTSIRALDFLTIGPFKRAVARDLVARASRRFAVPCRLVDSSVDLELPLLPGRLQVDADRVLGQIEEREAPRGTVTVGLTAKDLGVQVFTFVFGRARRHGRAALVSVARLAPEFYGLPCDSEVSARRAVAEILHEVSHVAGLEHCRDVSCLMRFSTSVEAIDLRGDSFCAGCAARLPRGLLSPAAGPV